MRLPAVRPFLVRAMDAVVAVVVLAGAFVPHHRPRHVEVQRTKGEVFHRYIHLRHYRSSVDPSLDLAAIVRLPERPGCVSITAHGWHGTLDEPSPDAGPRARLTVEVDMRGRAYSTGKQDLSGLELQDWIDALAFVRREYKDHIADPDCVYAEGGSGAGGNVYAIVGKFPDTFSAAVVRSGMSDYTRQYEEDEVGEFRRDCEEWIGGTPETNPEGYRSRSGLTTVANSRTPMHVDHGDTDVRVTVSHARRYVAAARAVGREVEYIEWPGVGDRRHWTNLRTEDETRLARSIDAFLDGHKVPPALPPKGHLVVAGYVKTRLFEVVLDHVDRIAELDYDVSEKPQARFVLRAKTARRARIAAPARPAAAWNEAAVTAAPRAGGWIEVEGPIDEVARVTLE